MEQPVVTLEEQLEHALARIQARRARKQVLRLRQYLYYCTSKASKLRQVNALARIQARRARKQALSLLASVYLLYWYNSTNTDAAGASRRCESTWRSGSSTRATRSSCMRLGTRFTGFTCFTSTNVAASSYTRRRGSSTRATRSSCMRLGTRFTCVTCFTGTKVAASSHTRRRGSATRATRSSGMRLSFLLYLLY